MTYILANRKTSLYTSFSEFNQLQLSNDSNCVDQKIEQLPFLLKDYEMSKKH